MAYDTLLVEVREQVAWITMNRPERRNALSEAMIAELAEALAQARGDDSVRAVVLTGSGEKAFCAGADLSPPSGGILAAHHGRGAYAGLFDAMASLGKPSIARVNGHALAGGLGLVLACDFAVAAEGATFGTPEVKRGLMPFMVMALLSRHVGPKRCLEMVLLGERFDAQEAAKLGLVNRVVAGAALDEAVGELARKICALSPAILRLGKDAYYRIRDQSVADSLDYLRSQLTINVLSEDAFEGVSAFLEKREPKWKGR